MKFSKSPAVVVAALPLLIAAHGGDSFARHARHLEVRQGSPSPPASGTTTTVAGSGTTVTTISGTLTVSTTPAPSFSFSLFATNPTAVPLASIVANETSSATRPLDSTAVPGTTPTFLPGAPALPNAALLHPADYPHLDLPPPVDSPEVLQWIQDVKDTGVVIPNITATVLGGCAANAAAAADQTRCWWTCGGCVRSTDITECPTPMNWGLTYDDGPSFYTSNLLNYLDQQSLKSTFFVVGSRVISFPATLQTQYMGQHQIAVHTWSHPSLTTLSNEEIIAELGWSKKVIKDVLGVTPNMMRPPFGDIDDRVRAISIAMGLTPVMWTRISPLATFDTDDFNIHGGSTSVQQVLQNWEHILGNATSMNSGFIVLEHDLFEQTVEVATGYILPDALAHNPPFTIKPVVQCRNLDMADAYIETNNNKTNPPAISAAVSGGVITIAPGAPGAQNTGSSASAPNSHNLSGVSLACMTAVIGILVGVYTVAF